MSVDRIYAFAGPSMGSLHSLTLAALYPQCVGRIECPTLLVNIDTDHEFPPECAEETAAILNAVRPGQATVRIIKSSWGHIGCIREPEQLGRCISDWLKSV